METMQVTTRAKAESILLDSLFNSKRTLNRELFCSGKYRKTPTELVGMEVRALPGVRAVYAVRSKDQHGHYTSLHCICE